MQEPLQQSVLPVHAAVAGAHAVIDDAHVFDFVSHSPEQHVDPVVHEPPKGVQSTLTLPSGPNPPELPLELAVPPVEPPPDELAVAPPDELVAVLPDEPPLAVPPDEPPVAPPPVDPPPVAPSTEESSPPSMSLPVVL
jgi:hypothetical protein